MDATDIEAADSAAPSTPPSPSAGAAAAAHQAPPSNGTPEPHHTHQPVTAATASFVPPRLEGVEGQGGGASAVAVGRFEVAAPQWQALQGHEEKGGHPGADEAVGGGGLAAAAVAACEGCDSEMRGPLVQIPKGESEEMRRVLQVRAGVSDD